MSYHSHRILTPGASRKRKEGEAFYPLKPTSVAYSAKHGARPAAVIKAEEAVSSNKLLAGYMAYEYLTKGTLFGQKFDPGRAEAVALAGGLVESKRGSKAIEMETRWKKEHKSYAEVAGILKTEGAHLPGIVNPTQLARWIQM
ncbi:uncharacterized protein LOC8263744 [Ricinus communis]|uniref:Uncharacterized protein n=1 Tax=Ricinus communis TaxID=3988 RepID=B9SS49_RICCO|nr:uncharacterized protein LOC8263744 [Ricinus communis]EEF33552.1 conserved hypothetical protein [Ricinus communis]|eukprot:XP_015580636.1 uncharacterized protein LOC8263744 [Ricinus communis]